MHWWQSDSTSHLGLLAMKVMQRGEDEPVIVDRRVGLVQVRIEQARGTAAMPEPAQALSGACSHFAIHGPSPELRGLDATLKRVVHD
mmetsp:Transcript_92805/g.207830  ORF Transcript_92805/g.207830 Transcript_92805/m.207830 type:complete len:87 (+) Transcript_92805:341-601(+)